MLQVNVVKRRQVHVVLVFAQQVRERLRGKGMGAMVVVMVCCDVAAAKQTARPVLHLERRLAGAVESAVDLPHLGAAQGVGGRISCRFRQQTLLQFDSPLFFKTLLQPQKGHKMLGR